MNVDYLQPVGRGGRIFAAISSLIASAICFFIAAVGALLIWGSKSSEAERKSGWLMVLLFGTLGAATAFFVVRLIRGSVAANGLTTMPVWFIQAFGVFFAIGTAVAVYMQHNWLMALEGVSVWIAMIFIGREVARRRGQRFENSPANSTPQHQDRRDDQTRK